MPLLLGLRSSTLKEVIGIDGVDDQQTTVINFFSSDVPLIIYDAKVRQKMKIERREIGDKRCGTRDRR